jgi:hypothetical protein
VNPCHTPPQLPSPAATTASSWSCSCSWPSTHRACRGGCAFGQGQRSRYVMLPWPASSAHFLPDLHLYSAPFGRTFYGARRSRPTLYRAEHHTPVGRRNDLMHLKHLGMCAALIHVHLS